MIHYDVLVVGGGHGGAQAAIALRQHKFAGTLAILSDEPEPPYERPPLSKDYLAGEKTFERILIRPESFWQERQIDLLTSQSAMHVDASARIVRTAAGQEIGYSHLVWAAGGSPRRLTCDGHDLAGLHTVRTRADVDRLLAELPDARQVVVIGGGYIGLEAAAVLTKIGKPVTLVEALDRVLARVAGAPLSRFFEDEHRSRGVDVRLNATVACVEGDGGKVKDILLADGTRLRADIVIVGIGIVASVGPLLEAGAVGGNGVLVDAQCRTTLPDVFAIGDCALHANSFAGGAEIRLESVQNAADQANVAARTILGEMAAYDAVPWFWSNQFDLKLQTVGLSQGHDDLVIRGDPRQRAFSIVYLREGRVMALDCVNAVRDYVQGRALVTSSAMIDKARLADATLPLKSLVNVP